jgi:hypothetical protein
MRIHRIRFTVRRLMIVVALVALSIWIFQLWKLRQHYLVKAAEHAGFREWVLRNNESIRHWEDRWTDNRQGKRAQYPWPAGPPFVPAMTNYHDDMRIKWERAARMPWLPVEPDPL